MPYAFAIGAISGSTTTIAEKMSMTVPTISRITLIASRNTIFDSTCCLRPVARASSGTSAVTMKFVSTVDAKMMMKIAPTIAIASWLVVPQRVATRASAMRTARTTLEDAHDVDDRQRGDLRQTEARSRGRRSRRTG